MKKIHVAAFVVTAALTAGAIVLSQGPAFQKVQPLALSRLRQIQAQQLGELKLQGGDPHTAFTANQTQMFAAGRNRVSVIGEDGKAQQSFNTGVQRPAIAPIDANNLLLADLDRGILIGLNIKNGQSQEMLKLSEVKDPKPADMPNMQMAENGQFSAAASDGKNVFVSYEAGFSSMIFKIDPATKQIVGRGFAACADPTSMNFQDGQLFVLCNEGSEVLRFSETIEKSHSNIRLPSKGNKGIGFKSGELRTLNTSRGAVMKFRVPTAQLAKTTLIANLDRVRLTPVRYFPIKYFPINFSQRYAVLICGDLAENFAGECFWNDTVWLFKALIANGYKPENIYVCYGDGADFLSANPAYRYAGTVTDFAATSAVVTTLFNGLKNGDAAKGIQKMDDNDTLFVWTFDHGGQSGGQSTLCLRGPDMLASDFNAKLNAIPYKQRAIFMQQCFSGGFIPGLTAGAHGAKTYITTACRADEVARPADTENEMVGGKSYSHGEFNYHITTALNRLKTSPPGGAVDADADNDTFVASKEMGDWNIAKESRPETPQSGGSAAIGNALRFKK